MTRNASCYITKRRAFVSIITFSIAYIYNDHVISIHSILESGSTILNLQNGNPNPTSTFTSSFGEIPNKISGQLNSFANQVGYFNLSCPFEMSKTSCAFLEYSEEDRARTRISSEYYKSVIRNAFDSTFFSGSNNQTTAKRVFMTGDSLTRQLFISLVCNAFTLYDGLVEHTEINWKEVDPCRNPSLCKIKGGEHGTFDAASVKFRGGMEVHFVPHKGFKDKGTAEVHVLERLAAEASNMGRVTFGKRTAMQPGGPVDVLVYNVGIHFGMDEFRDKLEYFVNKVTIPLIRKNLSARPRIIYFTTPTQHFNTSDGTFQGWRGSEWSLKCVDEVESNPRADIEKKILAPGVNIDVLLDYDDLNFGMMHVGKHDCAHYCMPGLPDTVAAKLLDLIK